MGLLADASDELTSIDLAPGDVGVLVTDGVTEAIEGFSLVLNQVLESLRRPPAATPIEDGNYLLGLAAGSSGPPGSRAWSDDRTVFAFRMSD